MNNKTIKNLILSGMLAFIFTTANSASAYVPGMWDPQPDAESSQFTTVIYNTEDPIVIAANTNTISTTTTQTSPVVTSPTTNTTPVAQTHTTKPATSKPKTTVKSNSSNLPVVNTNPTDNTSDLTALSINGSGGFMPSSFFQWFLVVLLILAIILVARKVANKPAQHGAQPAGAH